MKALETRDRLGPSSQCQPRPREQRSQSAARTRMGREARGWTHPRAAQHAIEDVARKLSSPHRPPHYRLHTLPRPTTHRAVVQTPEFPTTATARGLLVEFRRAALHACPVALPARGGRVERREHLLDLLLGQGRGSVKPPMGNGRESRFECVAVMNTNPSNSPECARCPVEQVTWEEATRNPRGRTSGRKTKKPRATRVPLRGVPLARRRLTAAAEVRSSYSA